MIEIKRRQTYVSYGKGENEQDVIVGAAKILGRNQVGYLFTAMEKQVPSLSSERLKELSEKLPWLFYVSWPDGLVGNKLVQVEKANRIPAALHFQGLN